MKNIPSCLNNILRDRYLKEAVTTAPQISYIKKEEEKPIYGTKTPVYTPPPLEPMTAKSFEVPGVEVLPERPLTREVVRQALERSKKSYLRDIPSERGYPGLPTQRGSRAAEIAERMRLSQLQKDARDAFETAQRMSADPFQSRGFLKRRDTTLPIGLGGLPEIDYSGAKKFIEPSIEKTKQLVRNMVPDLKSTLRTAPYQAAHLGVGYFPFVAAEELTDTDLLPNDPITGSDPISFTTGLAAAEVATPYLVDFPLGLAKGQGVGGALQSAAQVARAGLQRLPFMAAVYGTAYGMGHLMDWSRKQREPQFQKDMQEYKSRQAALETRRRKEGREETTGEATKRVWELNNILQSYISPTGPQF